MSVRGYIHIPSCDPKKINIEMIHHFDVYILGLQEDGTKYAM